MRHALQRPGEGLDYSNDWTESLVLTNDVITASSWAVTPNDAGEAAAGSPFTALGITSTVLSGLVFGKVYELTNTIITQQRPLGQKASITIRCGL
jgi:hypothetical protein